MATEVILKAYDYTNEAYFDVALDPDSKALLLKDVSVGITDHGSLIGLADDDHGQYYNATRHTKAVHDSLAIDHGSLTGLADDDHSQYYNAARHTVGVHNALAIDHGNLSGKSDNDHIQYLRALGAWSLKTITTIYQAATDGFVLVRAHSASVQNTDYVLQGLTDSGTPPSTKVCSIWIRLHEWTGPREQSFMLPVKKDDYWQISKNEIVGTITVVVYWIPLSN